MSIPSVIDSLTPARLTEVLRGAGAARADVTRVAVDRIGTGQTAACARLSLTYQRGGVAGPATVIAKYPSDNELSRSSAVAMGIYRREVEFYRDVAPRLTISLPRCHHLEVDDSGERFLILMEDLAPARAGDQLAGCSADVAQAAVLELVGLQAPTWCDIVPGDRFREPADGFFGDMYGLYGRMLPEFVSRFGDRLAADELAIIERLGASPGAPPFREVGSPFCLEHRDYRLDNLMIDTRRSPPRITVVDWQGMRTGRPLNDVALCLAGSLGPEERRAAEQSVLHNYHEGLLAAGVPDFTWGQCWYEYRRASFAGFGLTVVAAVAVEQTDRGDDMFAAMARRYARHALDVGADEFLA